MARRKSPAWSDGMRRLIFCTMMLISILLATSCMAQTDGGAALPTPAAAALPTSTPGLPDLAIQSARFEVADPFVGDCTSDSDIFRLNFSITNLGKAPSGPFSLQVNTLIQRIPTGLQPGETKELNFPYETNQPDIRLDPAGQVPESNEANNWFSSVLPLPEPPQVCIPTATPIPVIQQPLAALEGHTDPVLTVDFSPDGRLIASGSADDTLRLWTVEPPAPLRIMQGHTFPIVSLKFTPNGSQLLTGSMDGLIRSWQVANSLLLSTMHGHAGWVRTLDVSSNGQWLVSGSDDFTIRIWRLSNSSLYQTIDEGMTAINQVVFAPDANTYAWAEESGVIRIRTINGNHTQSYSAADQAATSLVFQPPGDRLIAGYADGTIRIWDIDGGDLQQSLNSHQPPITALAVSPDGRWLVSAQDNGSLDVWDLTSVRQTRSPAFLYAGHEGRINALDFSPLGNLIVSGSDDGTLLLWPAPANDLP